MKQAHFRLYLIFTVTFLVMHFTGTMVSGLPYILNALITGATVFGALFLLLKWNGAGSVKKIISELGFRETGLKSILPGIILSAALVLSYLLLSLLLNAKLMLAKEWLLNLAGLFLTAGLTEEALFRGYLFGGLRRNMSFRKAVLISAICFTLAHLVMFTNMNWPVALLSTLLAVAVSVPLAFLFEKGNHTVWSPAIVHTAIRTVGLVVTVDQKHFMQFSMMWIAACMMLPYIVLMFYKEFRLIWIKRA
jgi:membrane protease YdiL (CAAX protease family)